MKILSIYKYYWPDTAPYGSILKSILEKFAQDGHETSVLTAPPSYAEGPVEPQAARECVNGVNIRRLAVPKERKGSMLLRLAVFLLFLLKAYAHASRNQADLILVNSYPPVLMGLFARFLKWMKKIPYIYHCQDIHPESLFLAGFLKDGPLYSLLRTIDRGTCLSAAAVVTLSEDMVDTLTKRGLPRERLHILNNFIQQKANMPAAANILAKASANQCNILYAGNLGTFQGLENIIAAAELVSRQTADVRFFFMGAGLAKDDLAQAAGQMQNQTVFFIPFQPPDVAFAAMQNADFGIVALKARIYEVAFPSKTISYLSAGCPILLIAEKESKLGRFVLENDLGAVSAANPEEIAAVILDLFQNKVYWQNQRPHIQQVCWQNFSQDMILNRWASLLETIT